MSRSAGPGHVLAASLRRWAPAVAWMTLIFVLSAQPGLRISSDALVDAPLRHAAHLLVYAVLAGLFVHALDAINWPTVGVIAVMLATIYGVSDEVHQSFVPDRTGNPTDVVLDAAGAVLGVVLLRWWPALRRHWPTLLRR